MTYKKIKSGIKSYGVFIEDFRLTEHPANRSKTKKVRMSDSQALGLLPKAEINNAKADT